MGKMKVVKVLSVRFFLIHGAVIRTRYAHARERMVWTNMGIFNLL